MTREKSLGPLLVCGILFAEIIVAFNVVAAAINHEHKSAYTEFIFYHDSERYHFPYSSNMPLDEQNTSIERLLIAIHGSGYNPLDYLNSGIDSAAMVPGAADTTLVIAPHFLNTEYIPENIGPYFLYWVSYPFRGTQNAYRGPGQTPVAISAFTVLDIMLEDIVNGGAFPNLSRIVIAGHSAGGQMVNRYAASNRYDVPGVKPADISLRYVVMGPMAYLYFDGHRVVPGTLDQFEIPASPPDDYNEYPWGLDNLWAYLRETGADTIRDQYREREVRYLVGSEDNVINPDDRPAVLLQGPERLSRSEIYYNYLGFYYGSSIYDNHKRAVVEGVGHWGRGQMLSPVGLYFLYDVPPIEISSLEELQRIGNDQYYPLNWTYYLTSDIDASPASAWNTGAGFKPIGDLDRPFTGTFQGQDHVVTGLYINRPQEDFVALFGAVGASGSVSNLGIEDATVSGKENVGVLVGRNWGVASKCFGTGIVSGDTHVGILVGYNNSGATVSMGYGLGEVTGDWRVGGLVGRNSGTTTQCFANCLVDGGGNVGGLAGVNAGMISACYATSQVWGDNRVGGLVGENWGGSVSACYSIGMAAGRDRIGGLMGWNNSGMVESAFWDTESSGMAYSDGGLGLPTVQMQLKITFLNAGWDFDTVWDIAQSGGYPFLRVWNPDCIPDMEPPVLTLIGDDAIVHVCGTPFSDPGVMAVDNCDDNLSHLIHVSGTVDAQTPGEYLLTYTVSDTSGNAALPVMRTVTVENSTHPTILLIGGSTVSVPCGDSFMDPGYLAHDICDGDLTGDVTVTDIDAYISGLHTLYYEVTDSAGNITRTERTVHVVDINAPAITLVGERSVSVYLGEPFIDPGATAWDACDGDLTNAITVSDTVNVDVVGVYTVAYQVWDRAGNKAEETRQVRVWRDEPPVISLLGDNPLDVECGTLFTDPGVTAMDDVDGDISDAVITTGTVDSNTPGTYLLSYNVTDSAGNMADEATRTIRVVDTQAPVITLSGADPLEIEYSEPYEDPGATAWDVCDGDLTHAITVGGDTVVTTTPRTYTVRYRVEDSAGNERAVTRRVIVKPRAIVSVPDMTGMTLEEAEAALTAARLRLGAVVERHDDTVAAGKIISQTPAPGSSAMSGDAVNVTVSLGRRVADTEGEPITEGEGEGEDMPPDDDASTGCACNPASKSGDTFKRMLGDYLLLGAALLALFGMAHQRS